MGLKRRDYTCSRCGYVHEDVWVLVKNRRHLYCPKCMKNPEITRGEVMGPWSYDRERMNQVMDADVALEVYQDVAEEIA